LQQLFERCVLIKGECFLINSYYLHGIAASDSSSSATAGTIQNLAYNFDTLGNLLSRTDSIQAIIVSFDYNNLNRVTSSMVTPIGQATGGTAVSIAYDALGNITSKSDIGAYTYGPGTICTNVFAGTHAVSSVAGTKNANTGHTSSGQFTAAPNR
jgi:hypothetical protein